MLLAEVSMPVVLRNDLMRKGRAKIESAIGRTTKIILIHIDRTLAFLILSTTRYISSIFFCSSATEL